MDTQTLSMFIINGLSALVCIIQGVYFIILGKAEDAKEAFGFAFIMAIIGFVLWTIAIIAGIIIFMLFLCDRSVEWLCSFSKNNKR